MRSNALIALIASLLLALFAGNAHALLLLEPVGDPIEGNSWTQQWRFSIGADRCADRLDFTWGNPSTESFKLPIAWNLSKPTWSSYVSSPLFGWIQGPQLSNDCIEFNLSYTPHDCSTSLDHDIKVWDCDDLVECWTVKWDGGNWCSTPSSSDGSTVPEPASLALLACAIGGMGAMLRRRRKA